jgi:serine/threonine protein phosphatase PrpC
MCSSRKRTEDRAEVFEHESSLIVVVADGAGGIPGGAAASDAVVDAVRVTVQARSFDIHGVRTWCEVLRDTDVALSRSSAGGETTAIIVVIGPHGLLGTSVGDSEAWMVGRSTSRLTEGQRRTRIGTGRCRPSPFHRGALDGVLVIATDGLFRHAPADAIVRACTTGNVEIIVERLVDLPRLRSGAYPDDLAVVVVATPNTLTH